MAAVECAGWCAAEMMGEDDAGPVEVSDGSRRLSRVEEGRGGLSRWHSLRFPSPLIKPDVPISGIRLSDRLRGRPTATTNRRRLRLAVELVRSAPDRSRCFAGSSPITSVLAHFASTSEVRVLSSAGITRPQRSYDPVRLLPGPPPESDGGDATSNRTGLPRLPVLPFRRAAPITPADRTGACVDDLPVRAAFPKYTEGRRPHWFFRDPMRRGG
jgi:hypothetical protein